MSESGTAQGMSGSGRNRRWVAWPEGKLAYLFGFLTGKCSAVLEAEYVAEGTRGFAAFQQTMTDVTGKVSVPEAEKEDDEGAGKNREVKRFGSE